MSQLSKRNALSLRREWRLFDQDRGTPEAYLKLCNRMIEVGEFLLAHDVAKSWARAAQGKQGIEPARSTCFM